MLHCPSLSKRDVHGVFVHYLVGCVPVKRAAIYTKKLAVTVRGWYDVCLKQGAAKDIVQDGRLAADAAATVAGC